MVDQLVLGRECGACSQCCVTPAIDKPDIQKAPGTPCRHRAGGCAIYESRPQICRDYHCGWRRLAGVLQDWRPDLSGVFVELEADVPLQFRASIGMTLILVGNPLKTVRRHDFQEFVARNVRNNVFLFLGLPGPRGMQCVRLPLNTQYILDAAAQSRNAVRSALEKVLKRLSAHAFKPHAMEHAGHDFGL